MIFDMTKSNRITGHVKFRDLEYVYFIIICQFFAFLYFLIFEFNQDFYFLVIFGSPILLKFCIKIFKKKVVTEIYTGKVIDLNKVVSIESYPNRLKTSNKVTIIETSAGKIIIGENHDFLLKNLFLNKNNIVLFYFLDYHKIFQNLIPEFYLVSCKSLGLGLGDKFYLKTNGEINSLNCNQLFYEKYVRRRGFRAVVEKIFCYEECGMYSQIVAMIQKLFYSFFEINACEKYLCIDYKLNTCTFFPIEFNNKYFVIVVHENLDDLSIEEFHKKNKHLYNNKLKYILNKMKI